MKLMSNYLIFSLELKKNNMHDPIIGKWVILFLVIYGIFVLINLITNISLTNRERFF